jgi:ferredoxin
VSDAGVAPEAGELVVDLAVCQGHGRCYWLFPGLFEPGDDEGKSHVLAPHVSGKSYDDARRVVAECPERAITLRARR